jgi:hypothetical protein
MHPMFAKVERKRTAGMSRRSQHEQHGEKTKSFHMGVSSLVRQKASRKEVPLDVI